MKTLTTLFFLAISISFSQAGDTWIQKADFAGSARSEAVGFSINGKGYLSTGITGVTVFKDLWEYDPSADSWTQKADLPGAARFKAVAFIIGAKGYVGTGRDAASGDNLSDFWEYDQATNSWTQKADFGGGVRRDAIAFSIGNKGYVGTGHEDEGAEADLWEYDPASDSWTMKAILSGDGYDGARSGSVAFTIGSYGYVALGSDYQGFDIFDECWQYDPAADTWTQTFSFPGGLSTGFVAFASEGKGYVCGATSEVWEFDPTTGWEQKTDFPATPRLDAAAFVIDTKAYVVTGRINFTTNDLKEVWQYSPCDAIVYYQDADNDTYGNASITAVTCSTTPPLGYASDATDCNDNNSAINPGAAEVCNGIDDNCNGNIDEGCTATCTLPDSLQATKITSNSANLKWNAVISADGYNLRYKISGTGEWTKKKTSDTHKKIIDLAPSTEYVGQIKTNCSLSSGTTSEWSAKQHFTTDPGKYSDASASLQIDLSVFPNPNDGNMIIQINSSEQQSISIKLLDVMGKEMYSLDEDNVDGSFTKQLDLSNLTSGTYFLRVMHDGVSEMRKVVIEK